MKSYRYVQKSGKLLWGDTVLLATGYAGRYTGKNNPEMQNAKDTGPLPCGVYRIGDPYDHPKLGPLTFNLTPDSANDMFGRADFRIHGDSKADPGMASHGCIVVNRVAREFIAQGLKNGDRLLEVVADQKPVEVEA